MNTVSAEDEIDFTIRQYFSWFRQRRVNAAAISDRTFGPEQHILIGAALDALATAWGTTFEPGIRRGAERWQRFLETGGGEDSVFVRVAAPMLADDLAKNGRREHAAIVRNVVRDERHSGIVRFADESDPQFDEFLAHPNIVPLNLERRLVERFRFGEVLYKHYRCHWIHRGYASPLIGPSDMDDRQGWRDMMMRVRYWNVRTIGPNGELIPHRRPIFSVPWLLGVYDACLDAFEARCVAEHRAPVDRNGD